MSIVIFSGPTIAPAEIGRHLDARCLPPVRYGDVYRAVSLLRPHAIAIVDGYFNQVPAVWHKEILWAMTRGVRVFGAASMGALRAAELDRFGMQGVGEVYAAYRDGRYPPYDDAFGNDDEVAVLHGPVETGYRAVSEALVNIRATLAAAAREGIIDGETRDRLVKLAGNRFYAERSFKTLLADAAGTGIDGDLIGRLESWTAAHRVDQKHRDARQLLNRLSHLDDEPPTIPEFRFEHTTLWDNATRELTRSPATCSPTLDELRLLGPDFFALRDELLEESLGGPPADPGDDTPPQVDDTWFQQPLRSLELARFRESAPPHWLTHRMLARVAECGDLARLERRAADKQNKLGGGRARAAELSELELLQLMDWYFDGQLGAEIPDDIAAYAERLGGLDVDEFYELVLREYEYLHGGG